MDVSGLYPNIPHREGLASLHKFLETRDNKQITSDALAEVEKVVLKNNMTFQQKCETVIAKKFEHLYAIFFMVDFEEKIIESLKNKPMIQWCYIDNIFFIWETGEESLKVFIEQVNIIHTTIKCTAEYSRGEVNFVDVNTKLINGELNTDLFFKPMGTHQFQIQLLVILTTAKREYLTVRF